MTALGTDTPLEQNSCNLSFWWTHGMLNLIHVNRAEQGTIIAWSHAKLLKSREFPDRSEEMNQEQMQRKNTKGPGWNYISLKIRPSKNYDLYTTLYYANNSVYKSIINYYT